MTRAVSSSTMRQCCPRLRRPSRRIMTAPPDSAGPPPRTLLRPPSRAHQRSTANKCGWPRRARIVRTSIPLRPQSMPRLQPRPVLPASVPLERSRRTRPGPKSDLGGSGFGRPHASSMVRRYAHRHRARWLALLDTLGTTCRAPGQLSYHVSCQHSSAPMRASDASETPPRPSLTGRMNTGRPRRCPRVHDSSGSRPDRCW